MTHRSHATREPVVAFAAQIVMPTTLRPPSPEEDGIQPIAGVHRSLRPLLDSVPALDVIVHPDKVQMVVDERLAGAVARLTVSAQLDVWANDSVPADAPRLAIGLAAGPASHLLSADGKTHWVGETIMRAGMLSDRAAAGAVIADMSFRDLLRESGQVLNGQGKPLGFGQKLTFRETGNEEDLVCFELLWGDRTYGLRRRGKSVRRRGTVQRWDTDRHHGFVVTDDGDFFYTDRRYLTGSSDPRPGQTVFFLAAPPLQSGKNPVASALVGVGDRTTGKIVRTQAQEQIRMRVTDRVLNSQDIQLNEAEVPPGMKFGDMVRFTVAEEARGPIALAIEISDDLPSSRNEITKADLDEGASVTDRFIVEVMDTLARKGAGGAAGAVQRATRKRPGAMSRSSRAEQDRVFALADHAIQVWVRRALEMIDQDVLAVRIGTLEPITTAEHAALAARWLKDFIAKLGDATKSRFGDDYAPVFSETLRAASHAAQISRHEGEPTTEPMLLSIQHAAKACALAFGVGVFTALPPEMRDVARKLDAIGAVTVDEGISPLGLREQVVSLLRVEDRVGLRETLRRERTHFERGTLERLQLAGDSLGGSADFDRLKPVEADLWTLAERRLATLLPLVEYSAELLSEEAQALARFAERSVPTRATTAAWREGHRWSVWLVVWSLGVAASAGGHWASARALWDTGTSERDEVVPLAAMRQLGGSSLGDHLTLARFGKRMPLDGLWHLAFGLSRSDLILEHYGEMLQGPTPDAPLGFLSRAGDWSWLLAALSGQAGGATEIPKYWKGSQVDLTFPGRLQGDKLLSLAVAASLFRAPTETVIDHAARWAKNAPGPQVA